MQFQFTLYVVPQLAAGALSVFLAGYAWRRRGLPAATPFALVMACTVLWAVANTLELAGTDLSTKLIWANVQYFSVVAVPVAWFITAVEYTGNEDWLTRRKLAALWAIPVVTLGLVWTNDLHGLMRRNVRLDASGLFSVIVKDYGPWFWVLTAFEYVLLAASAVLLFRMMRRTPGPHRVQATVLAVGMLLPVSTNAAFILGLKGTYAMDMTPAALGIGGIAVAWAILRHGLFNIIPVARDKVIEWMADGVAVIDAQGRLVSLNPAAERILGIPADRAIGRSARRLFRSWPDLAALATASGTAQAELQTGGNVAPRYYEAFASTLTDNRMRPVGRTITLHDSTKAKMVERALKESEDRYKEMASSVPIAIYEADLSGRLVLGNRSGVELFGYTWDDFEKGLNIFELIAAEDREPAARAMAAILAGEPSQLREYTALRKDGVTFPAMISATPVLRDGQTAGIKGFVLDVATRKRAEEALRVSEERYRTLAEAAHDLIFITALDGTLEYVNGYAARQCRRTQDQLVGMPVANLLAWDSPERQLETIRNVAATGSPTYFEHRSTFDGGEVWLHTCLSPLRGDRGRVTSVLGVSRDTTELATMREELRALSLVDDLTGLHNRRGFLALSEQQLKVAERTHQAVSILLADFDGLKEINDTYGHEEGDRALVAVARLLKEVCRESDVVARLGGDEFAIMAIDTESPVVESLAHRILRAVGAENRTGSYPYRLSISVGVVHDHITSVDSIDQLLAESDKLMYQEKRRKAPSSLAT